MQQKPEDAVADLYSSARSHAIPGGPRVLARDLGRQVAEALDRSWTV